MPRKRDYAAEYARRQARARLEGFAGYSAKRTAQETKPAEAYYHLSPKEKDVWHKVYRALQDMLNKGLSLSQAAREQNTSPRSVAKYAGDKIEKVGRRWKPTEEYTQRQGAPVRVIVEDGLQEMNISDPATRSEYATYLSYIKQVFTGPIWSRQEAMDKLEAFAGKEFTDAQGRKHPYITDIKLLVKLYDDGEISMDEFYVAEKS